MHKNDNTNSITSDDNTDNTISTVIKLKQWLQNNYNYNTSLLPYHIQYNTTYKGYGIYSKQEFSVTCGNDLNQLKALLNNNNNNNKKRKSIKNNNNNKNNPNKLIHTHINNNNDEIYNNTMLLSIHNE